jgi:hypothetical protein
LLIPPSPSQSTHSALTSKLRDTIDIFRKESNTFCSGHTHYSSIRTMISETYILQQFEQCPSREQVGILMKALDHMKADDRRTRAECIALAMGIPLFPKVERIEDISGYTIHVTFDNSEERQIDFQSFFNPERRLEKQLLEDYDKFKAVEVVDGTLVWPSVGIESTGADEEPVTHPYDIDPALLYEQGRAVRYDEA